MRRAPIFYAVILALLLVVGTTAANAKPKSKQKPLRSKKQRIEHPILGNPNSPYRGWDYLASRLRATGVSEADIAAIYKDPKMPPFTLIPFKVKPKESHGMYTAFQRQTYADIGAAFVDEYDDEFDKVERTYNVPREVVAAILVIETRIGKNTGKDLTVYRLSRLASVLDPNNLAENYKRQKRDNPTVTLEEVKNRGRYLENTFLPEIPALIQIAKRNGVNIFNIRGSSAGAFGIPQFIPTALIKFGVDGDGDGHISLYNKVDALWSTANYLAAFGYSPSLPYAERRKVIWEYNRSDAYIDAVFRVSSGIRALGVMGCKNKMRLTKDDTNPIKVGWCPNER